MKPRLLDLFCGAGGCSVGYSRAGFDVVGVDKHPMKNYPFEFIQADALDVLADVEFCRRFDAIHASPPCQHYSNATLMTGKHEDHPDLVPTVRAMLEAIGVPYVIENVPGAPMRDYLELCGCMFNLRVIRKRLFECKPSIWFPPYACKCGSKSGAGSSYGQYQSFETHRTITVAGRGWRIRDGKEAMQINWMTGKELAQAIPPAYTQYIGTQLLHHIQTTQPQ